MRIATCAKIQHGGGGHLDFSLKAIFWSDLKYQVERLHTNQNCYSGFSQMLNKSV